MAEKKPAIQSVLETTLTGASPTPADVNVTDQTFYTTDGKPIKVSDGASIAKAFQEGQVGVKPGQKVTIRRPDTGELVSVVASDLDQALSQGAQIATNQEHRQALLDKKYGGSPLGAFTSTVSALGSGVGRGFSFGLSDKARVEAARLWGGDEDAKKTGRELKELEEYAPVASNVGEFGGVALQTALPVPKLGLAAKLGSATEGAGLLGRAAVGATKIGTSAAEGAAYGVMGQIGHNVSESAFGDTDLTAEKILAGTGEGAVFGALLGGGLGAAGVGLGAIRKAVAPEMSKLGAKAVFDMHGNVSKANQGRLAKIGTGAEVADTLARHPQVIEQDVEKALSGVRGAKQSVIDGLTELRGGQPFEIEGSHILNKVGSQDFINIAGKGYTAEQAAETFPWFRQAYNDFHTQELEPILEKLNLMSRGPEGQLIQTHQTKVPLADLLEQRMGLDSQIRWDAANPGGVSRNEIRKSLRGALEDLIEEEIGRTAGTDQLAKLKQLKKDYRVLSVLEDHVSTAAAKDQSVMQNWLPKNGFSAGVFGGIAGNAIGGGVGSAVGSLATLGAKALWNNGGKAQFAHTMLKMGDLSAAKGLVGAIDQTLDNTIVKALAATHESKLTTEKGDKGSIDKQYAAANAQFEQLRQLSNDPEQMNTRLANAYGPLGNNMPQTHQAVVGTVTRAVNFLQSKEPPKAGDVNKLQPGLNSTAPSDLDKQKFILYSRTIRDPMSVLKDFRNGSVSPEQVETLKAVYPKLYDDIRQRVLTSVNDMTQKGKEVPYRRRLELASLFGAPDMDPTLNPAYIQQIQGTFGSGTQAPQPGQSPQQQGPAGKSSPPMQGFSKMVTQFSTAERRMR